MDFVNKGNLHDKITIEWNQILIESMGELKTIENMHKKPGSMIPNLKEFQSKLGKVDGNSE